MKSTIPALMTLMALAGCISLKPSVRPGYTGLDEVDNANVTQLIGSWSAIELNPIANTKPQITFIDYKSDGTVNGIIPARKGSTNTLDTLEFRLSGDWTLEEDVVTHSNMTIQSTGDSELDLILNQTLRNQDSLSSRANIHEISDNRIVMVSEDGKAIEYTRQ